MADIASEHDLTPRALQTRKRIVEAASCLFASRGYYATTMRDIAESAGCSLGLTYRYFDHKEELVLALYSDLADQTADYITALPMETMADRFKRVLQHKIDQIEPYRAALGALFGAAMQPESGISLRAEAMEPVRLRLMQAFQQLVDDARDRPAKDEMARSVAVLLYCVHLLVIFFWLLDRTPQYRATGYFIDFTHEALRLMRPLMFTPVMSKATSKMASIFMLVFGGARLVDDGEDEPVTISKLNA